MYERFYQLRERPFALSPDPDYLYPSRVHREALDYLRYGLESHAGFVVITGEIGSGKTTLLQTLLRGLDTQTTVGRIVNTMLEPRELLETIMIDFGLDPAGRSKPLMLRDLAQYLVDQRLSGRMVLLVIDEAQNLGLAALEELRMLSNLETEKSKLMQIVLVGQPNLREKLNAPELEQLRQRVTVSYHLQPLDADETENYINHRLKRAALGAPLEFPREATDTIHGRSRGVPRIINVICDAALVFGYAEERAQVNLGLIEEVLGELEVTGVLPPATAGQPGGEGGVPARQGALPAAQGAPHVARPPQPERAGAGIPHIAPQLTRTMEHVPPSTAHVAHSTPHVAPRTSDVPRSTSDMLRSTSDVPRSTSDMLRSTAEVARSTSHVAANTSHVAPSTSHLARSTSDVSDRSALLDQREDSLKQRERELAEQRRILAEEYRLMRTRSAAPAAASAPTVRVQVASPMHMNAARGETFWQRVKRTILGASSPAIE